METNVTDPPHFETDSEGKIIVNPVTGWDIATHAGMNVILAIRYARTPEALESGEGESIQFLLTTQCCLELAERLTKLAKRLLEDQALSQMPPN